MKPHIRKNVQGLWYCSQQSEYGKLYGFGETPKLAYKHMMNVRQSRIKLLKGA